MLFLTFTAGAGRAAGVATACFVGARVTGSDAFEGLADTGAGAALAAGFGAGLGGALATGLDACFGAALVGALGAGRDAVLGTGLADALGGAFATAFVAGFGAAFAATLVFTCAFACAFAAAFTGAFAAGLEAGAFLGAGFAAAFGAGFPPLAAGDPETFLMVFFTGKSLFVPRAPSCCLCLARPASGPVSEKAGSLTNAADGSKACGA